MRVTKIFTFDSAHQLSGPKAEPLHGHTYTLHVTIEGHMQEDGMVMDFRDLKKIVNENVIEKIDHHNLNDILENPSAEFIAKWIWEKLVAKLEMRLVEIKVFETATSFVTYNGE